MQEIIFTKDNKKLKGLLTDFINEKAKNYVEPVRKGTPRGEPIGYSKKKFLAVLYSLTSIRLKKQASLLDVSYGLLRKWHSEFRFQELGGQLAEEFEINFMKKFRLEGEKTRKAVEDLFKILYETPFHKVPSLVGAYPFQVYGFLEDQVIYGGEILLPLFLNLMNYIKDESDPVLAMAASHNVSYIYKRPDSKLSIENRKSAEMNLIDDVIAILSGKEITDTKRKLCIFLMCKYKSGV